jgi:two-component system response regulator
MTLSTAVPVVILIADDDDDDVMLMRAALREARLANPIVRVRDGIELLDYLRSHRDPLTEGFPGILLLDLNMPRMDGREALRVLKADPGLRRLPVIVLTTSCAEEDIARSYEAGVNSFVTKPVKFDALVEATRVLGRYWFEIVCLPQKEEVAHG